MIAPSCAKNGGTTLSQTVPSDVGRVQRLERFQERIWRGSPAMGVPRAASTAAAHARSSAGPPGLAYE